MMHNNVRVLLVVFHFFIIVCLFYILLGCSSFVVSFSLSSVFFSLLSKLLSAMWLTKRIFIFVTSYCPIIKHLRIIWPT